MPKAWCAEVKRESIAGPKNNPASPWKAADSCRLCRCELAFPLLQDQQWSGESSFVEPPSFMPVSHTVLFSVVPQKARFGMLIG